ncbi:MAG: hypothetical protein NVS2B17_14910 [Candidatus Velthaea sp.]
MNRLVSALALAVFAGVASPALAADATTTPASSNEGVIVCRVAQSGEKPNARMMVADTTLICKPIDSKVSIRMIGRVKTKSVRQMGPVVSSALTPAQMDAAWHTYLNKIMDIAPNLP